MIDPGAETIQKLQQPQPIRQALLYNNGYDQYPKEFASLSLGVKKDVFWPSFQISHNNFIFINIQSSFGAVLSLLSKDHQTGIRFSYYWLKEP